MLWLSGWFNLLLGLLAPGSGRSLLPFHVAPPLSGTKSEVGARFGWFIQRSGFLAAGRWS